MYFDYLTLVGLLSAISVSGILRERPGTKGT
jgi:hypothetical protein